MKQSIRIILSVSIIIQVIFYLGLNAIEKRYPDFDKNTYEPPIIGQDSPDFYLLAENIRNNNFFSLDNQTPETFRTPGYPFFLALTGNGCFSLLLSILMTAVSAVLVYLIALQLLPNKYSLIAGIVYSLSPSVMFHGVVFLSDGLFTFLLLLSVYLYLYKRKYFWIGVLIGCATLVRPIGLYLPILFLLFPPYEKKKLLLLLGFVIVISPWMVRNHSFSISSITSYNMAYYNVFSFTKSDIYFAHLLNLEKTHNLRLLENQQILKEIVGRELHGKYIEYALHHISFIPKYFISSPIRYISINTGNIFNNFIGINAKTPFTILNLDRLYMLIVSTLAVIAIFNRNRKVWLFVVLIGYFAVLTGPVAIPRYRLPVDGFIIILALYSTYSIMPTICRKLRQKP